MPGEHEPLEQVRKSFKVDWYRCPTRPEQFRRLAKRSNLKGAFQAFGHLAFIVFTGGMTCYFFTSRLWLGMAIALFLHGIVYSFIPGLVTHELSHGTVFKARWLNAFFLRLYSLLGWVNFHHYKRSHTFHHLYTLHPRGDREVVLPGHPSLHPLQLFWRFTFNFPRLFQVVGSTVRLAFTGRFREEWSNAIFPPENPEARRVAVNWARMILLFHATILVVSIIFQLWLLPVLVTFAMFIANFWMYFIGLTMHMGLRDNVPDFRLCCRTIKLDPFSRFIYWNMNYHIEHHMFAAIPCYHLRKLSRMITPDMPKPRGLIDAWREMRFTYRRQKEDPSYQWDTPLPEKPFPVNGDKEPLRSSIESLLRKTSSNGA